MGGLVPPAPLDGPDPSLPWAPLVWPFIWRGGGERGGGKGAAALFTALYAPGSSRMSDARRGGVSGVGVGVFERQPCAPRWRAAEAQLVGLGARPRRNRNAQRAAGCWRSVYAGRGGPATACEVGVGECGAGRVDALEARWCWSRLRAAGGGRQASSVGQGRSAAT